jgi:hypothetical protein
MDFSNPLAALQQYKQSLTGGRGAYDQALAQQFATMQQPVDRQGALLRMAQGFLSPTKTGAFAENLGMAVGNYADANDKNREQEMDRAMKLAQIQVARAKLQMEGAGQDFDLFSKGHGMMQDQRRQQAWDGLSAPPVSLDNVVEQMNQTGMALPSGGLDASGFAPGFNNAPVDAPVRRVTPQRSMPDEAAGEQRQMEDMMRLRALEEEAAGADLPPAPNRVGAQPGPGAAMQLGDAPMAYASGPAQEPSLLSPEMAITPEQMQRFQRPQPQQVAPQQAPQQPMPRPNSPEGIALSEAGRMIELLHSPRGLAIRKIDPEGWQAREKAAVETLNKFATTDTRNFTAAQSDPAFLDFLRQQAEAKRPQTSVSVGGQESAFNKGAGEFLSGEMTGAYQTAARQRERLNQYEQIGALLSDPNVYTGAGGQTIATLKQFGKTFLGMDGIEGVENVEAAERIRAALFAGFRSEMLTGATSNADREFVMQIPANVTDSKAGIDLVLRMQRQAAEVAEQKAAIWDEVLKERDGTINMQDFVRIRNRIAAMDVFSPEDMREMMDVARNNAQQNGPLAGLPLDQVPSDILQDALNGLLTRKELEDFLASQGSSR